MTADRKVTVRSLLSEIDRIVLLLAIVVLGASVAGFLVVATFFRNSTWRELFLAIIANVATSVLIYIAIYVSLSRVIGMRRAVENEELINEIISGLSRKETIALTSGAVSLSKSENERIINSRIQPEKRQIIQRFLEATYLLIVALTKNHDLRIYCHITGKSDGLLYPINIVSVHRDDDYRVAIPFRGPDSRPFIVAQAMATAQIVGRNLPPNHRELYPDDLKLKILASLKCVIAVPILAYDPNEGETNPLGTVSVDCTSATLEQLGMVDDNDIVVSEVNDILKSCARAVHFVLTYTELV